jgi:flagellar biosynthetic protein FlhB
MAEEASDDKTEEPTSRRLSQARERGEVPRSPDFGGAIEVLVVCGLLFFIGKDIVDGIAEILRQSLTFSRAEIESTGDLAAFAGKRLVEGLWTVKWVFVATITIAVLASVINGGFNFSSQAAAPRFSKLNPLTGLNRMFGAQAWVGLLRNLVKFAVIAAVMFGILYARRFEMIALSRDALEPMISAGATLAFLVFTLVSVAVAALAIVDVPYQRWNYLRRLRMTKQEVRDEMKDIEGRPEVKRQIRRKQRELSRGKMLEKVRDADVVIVNPSEFAVALEYDEARNPVPILLAKGRGEIAAAIKEQAKRAGVPLVSSPPLARAIYFTTELDREVPEGLYRAVAAVLAYVFRLSALTPGLQIPEVPQAKLPPEFTFDEDGNSPTGRPA